MSKRFQSFDFSRKNYSDKNNFYYLNKQVMPQANKYDTSHQQSLSIYEKSFLQKQNNKKQIENNFLPSDVYELYSDQDKVNNIVQKIKTKQQLEVDQLILMMQEKFMKIINDQKEKVQQLIQNNWKNFDNIYQQFRQHVHSFMEDYNFQVQQDEINFDEEIQKIQNSDRYFQDPFKLQLNMVQLQKKKIKNQEALLNKVKQNYQRSQIPQLSQDIFELLYSQNSILDQKVIDSSVLRCTQYIQQNLNF